MRYRNPNTKQCVLLPKAGEWGESVCGTSQSSLMWLLQSNQVRWMHWCPKEGSDSQFTIQLISRLLKSSPAVQVQHLRSLDMFWSLCLGNWNWSRGINMWSDVSYTNIFITDEMLVYKDVEGLPKLVSTLTNRNRGESIVIHCSLILGVNKINILRWYWLLKVPCSQNTADQPQSQASLALALLALRCKEEEFV